MANDRRTQKGEEEELDTGEESLNGEGRSQGFVGEVMKKLFMAGLSAAFMTEEHIRSYLSEVRLPKEVLNTVLQGAAKSKEEIVHRVGKEVINILKKIDFVQEASKFAEEHTFKIKAEVEVVRKDRTTSSKDSG